MNYYMIVAAFVALISIAPINATFGRIFRSDFEDSSPEVRAAALIFSFIVSVFLAIIVGAIWIIVAPCAIAWLFVVRHLRIKEGGKR